MSIQLKEKKVSSQSHFGLLTERMNDYRESVLDKKPYICA